MGESKKALLALAFMIAIMAAAFLWFGIDAPDVRVSTWVWRVVLTAAAAASLVFLLWGMFRRDKVPDYLREMFGKPFERDGFCFGIEPLVVDGVFAFRVWYQSRFDRRSRARIVLKPTRDFFGRKTEAEVLHLTIEVEPAGFGFVMVPFAVPEKVQGKKQAFHIAAGVTYPDGKGQMVRFRDGLDVGSVSSVTEAALVIGALAAGMFVMIRPATCKMEMPSGVSVAVPEGIKHRAVDLWKMGDITSARAAETFAKAARSPSWGSM